MAVLSLVRLKLGPSPDASPIEFEPAALNVFVGPNNAGKSLALREVAGVELSTNYRGELKVEARAPTGDNDHLHVASEVRLARSLQEQLLHQALAQLDGLVHDVVGQGDTASGRLASTYAQIRQRIFDRMLDGQEMRSHKDLKTIVREELESTELENGERLLALLGGRFLSDAAGNHLKQLWHYGRPGNWWSNEVLFLTAFDRLTLAGGQSIGERAGRSTSRLESVFRDYSLRESARKYVHEALKRYLLFDLTGGGSLRLRLGDAPPPGANFEDGWTLENAEFQQQAELLSDQSDGVNAYVGMLIHALGSDQRLMFVDEPEAFLHPPLARRLAKQLGQIAVQKNRHVFVATHSPEFLMGCVQAGVGLNVIRLDRTGGKATARLLDRARLEELMRDPLLRSTSLLSALFHDGAIICEADADRTLYQEVNERLLEQGDGRSDEGLEHCAFLNAQNWQTVDRLLKPLRDMGVAAACIVDSDAAVHQDFRKIVEAAGVPSSKVNGLGQTRGQLLSGIFAGKVGNAKKEGLEALTLEERREWLDYVEDLKRYGIFVVPRGELEEWLPALGVPKPTSKQAKSNWIIGIMEKLGADPDDSAYVRPDDGDIWAFMREVAGWVKSPR